MADTSITEIVHQNPDAVEESLYGHLAQEDITGRRATDATPANTPPQSLTPASPAPEPLPNPVIPPAVSVPAEPAAVVPPVEPVDPVEPTTPPPAPPVPSEPPVPAVPQPPVPSPEPPVVTPPPVDPTAGWSPVDRRANELKLRNPDLTLEESISRAKQELGIVDPDPNAPAPEPVKTTAELLAEVDAQLNEAGAAEGLYTPAIAALTKEQARLSGLLAVETAEAARAQQAYVAGVQQEREASRARVLEICPESNDPTTAIGKALSAEIEAATAVDHPDLYEPNAPEIFLAKANLRLPEAERVEMKRPQAPSPAPAVQQPPTPPSAAPVVPEPAAPSSVLPVPASSRSAQPASINPADIGRITKEMPADELEAALYSGGGNGALLRM